MSDLPAVPPQPAPRPAGYRIPSVPPRLTYVFLGLTVIVFLAQALGKFLLGFDLVAALGLKDNAGIVVGQYWRLITPVFLHAGILHILFNMYALVAIGPQVEAPFGYVRFGVIYLLSGVTGVVLSMAFSPYPSVGASGAIFGLIGALGVYLVRHREAFGSFGQRRLTNLITIIVINLAIGLSPGIDNWGHLGGLIGGAALALLIGPRFGLALDYTTGQMIVSDQSSQAERALRLFGFGLVLLAAIVGVILYRARG